jgi:predicted amidohydrolase
MRAQVAAQIRLTSGSIVEGRASVLTHAEMNAGDTLDRPNGNRIASIARSTKHNPKAGQIVDANGEYLIPGLWDMHTHVFFDSTAAESQFPNTRLYHWS